VSDRVSSDLGRVPAQPCGPGPKEGLSDAVGDELVRLPRVEPKAVLKGEEEQQKMKVSEMVKVLRGNGRTSPVGVHSR
jgi:hypothetical protein